MTRALVLDKLESLRRCVARVEARRAPTAKALAADPDCQDIVTLNLTRAVQLCVDVAAHLVAAREVPAPRTMGEAFDALASEGVLSIELAGRLRAAVGFRNVAVHAYQTIDWNVVHAISHDHLDDFRAFAAAVVSHLPGA